MGKAEEQHDAAGLAAAVPAVDPEGNAGMSCPRCRPSGRVVRLRCAAALLLGVAVLLSALFWLPPFRRLHRPEDSELDSQFSADIVASFKLHEPSYLLNGNIEKLEYDIFEEIGVPNSLVVVMSLETSEDSVWTRVVFGIWPYPKNSTISAAALSILKSSLVSLVLRQSTLDLTRSLFGNSSFFQLLKFPGGITIVPPQTAFLLQTVHVLFNFTLHSSITHVQNKFDELTNQMKSGLLLNSYENLYVRLTNLNGSTMAPPTIVQTSVVLAVGNRPPSLPRLKQLAQTIRNSSAENLGLNHTVFGRVKQIRLSSFLQRSLFNGAAPSPAPQLQENRHHYQHHQHHHHHLHFNTHKAPSPSPSIDLRYSQNPSICRSHTAKMSSKVHLVPGAAPMATRHHVYDNLAPDAAPLASHPHQPALHLHGNPPDLAPHVLPSSPPAVFYIPNLQPSSYDETVTKPHVGMPLISPSPAPSSSVASRPHICWLFVRLLYSILCL